MDAAEVVEKHKRQVHTIAMRMQRTAVWDHEDMMQEGFIGLLNAAEHHDPAKGQLSTIAQYRIKGQIADAKRKMDPVPRSMAAKGFDHARSEVSLDESVSPDVPLAKTELLADPNAPDPLELVVTEDTAELVRSVLGELGERDREVLHLYYFEGMPLSVIGEHLGVTESRVCQIHRKALVRMRARLRSELIDAE